MAKRQGNLYTDSKHYYDWLDRADEDILSAGLLCVDEDCYNAAAFHCQQAIEKALKAYILLKSNVLVDGHNLSWLCKRAMRYDRGFSRYLDDCSSLNRCYIETRYPADIPLELNEEQVTRYCAIANEMYAFICDEVDRLLEEKKAHPRQLAAPPD